MIKTSKNTVYDDKDTLLILGHEEWYCFGQTIDHFSWDTSKIIEYIVDGPNWAVEEVEARKK